MRRNVQRNNVVVIPLFFSFYSETLIYWAYMEKELDPINRICSTLHSLRKAVNCTYILYETRSSTVGEGETKGIIWEEAFNYFLPLAA